MYAFYIYFRTFSCLLGMKILYAKHIKASLKYMKMHTFSYILREPYPAWDLYVEPFIIRQFAILFTIGNSFIKGMTSDNTPDINPDIKTYVKDIKTELEIFDENKSATKE